MRGIGRPLELLGKDLRALVFGTPPLYETRIDIDDPVLRNMLPPEQPKLHQAIGAGGTRRACPY